MSARPRIPSRRAAAGLLAVGVAAGVWLKSARDGPGPAPGSTPARLAGYGPPVLLGSLEDEAVSESSGLVASRRSPGLLWTHNDSGDGPFLYCLDRRGRSCGVWRVNGASARDWEDIAAGPGPVAREPYLYVGDIGDNLGTLPEVVVYRVPEPAPGPGDAAATREAPAATAAAEAIRLTYPDGPHDAEALLVHPSSGDLYLVTKEPSGTAGVYRAAAPLGTGRPVALVHVAPLRLAGGAVAAGRPRALPSGSLSGVVTGADVAPDGRRVALSTYLGGYELALPAGSRLDAIWSRPPTPIVLGPRTQGESIAYRLDGEALLTTSEGIPAPLHEVVRRR